MAYGKRNGKGTFKYASGTVYEGDFVDNHKCGFGIYHHISGEKYEG